MHNQHWPAFSSFLLPLLPLPILFQDVRSDSVDLRIEGPTCLPFLILAKRLVLIIAVKLFHSRQTHTESEF